ncbi:TIGR00180 family glycosyltransferase [Chloroflexota bacterium]
MADKYSIIIPTHDRPGCLQRLLSYYSSFGIKFNIIVADSSSDENKELNKKFISSVSNLDIQYIDARTDLIEKLADAVEHVNTEYCMPCCADDDFVTPNGIIQSVDFLEKNPDFAIAQGYYVAFRMRTDEKGEPELYLDHPWAHESILFPEPENRLKYHLSNYTQLTGQAVHRTDFVKMIIEETEKFTDDGRFGELLPSMLGLIYGKMKYLDVLYQARDCIPGSLGRTMNNFRDFIKDNTYHEKYARFRDCLSDHLSKQSLLDIEESKKVVDEAMSLYMKKYHSYNPLKSTIIDPLIREAVVVLDYLRLPGWLDKSIRAPYRIGVALTTPEPVSYFPPGFDDDFDKIKIHVLSSLKE